MSPPTLTSDQRSVIAAHKHDTTLFLLAAPATGRLADEVQRRIPKARRHGDRLYGRKVERIPGDDPTQAPRPKSWTMAVILHADFDLGGLIPWARRLATRDQQRIRFHYRPPFDPDRFLTPWTEIQASPVHFAHDDTNGLIQHCLEQLNAQTYLDHQHDGIPGIR